MYSLLNDIKIQLGNFSRQPVRLFFSILIYLLLTACQISISDHNRTTWVYTDLRTVSADFSTDPYNDIVAAYTRESGSDIQIRLDFLDISRDFHSEIYIALDTQPGGTSYLPPAAESQLEWDTLIRVPVNGSPVAYTPAPPGAIGDRINIREDLTPRVYRDLQNDYLIVSLNKFFLPQYSQIFQAEIFLADILGGQIIDTIGPFRFDDSPNYRLPVLLAFWNVFPAYTPAQALRRWDGAHTGPLGERHGLKMLLDSIKQNNIPATLLDLQAPYSLSALDYLGHLQFIQQLAAEQLIILPDYLPGNISNTNEIDFTSSEFIEEWARERYRKISQGFGISPSSLLFSSQLISYQPSGYQMIFTLSPVNIPPFQWGSAIVIPIHSKSQEQLAPNQGFSLATRKELLNSYHKGTTYNSNFYILGGSLPETNWGDPESANAAMQYLANHPWLKPITSSDLVAMRRGWIYTHASNTILNDLSPVIDSPSEEPIQFKSSNKDSADNPVLSAAFQAYSSLFFPLPPEPDHIKDLRNNYFNQIGHFLHAAQWAEQPFSLSSCDLDTDNDGQNECVLASTHHYAIFENTGARLILLFIRLKDAEDWKSEIHQLIGPTSQFFVGFGDPSMWQIDSGESADTGGTHGAFFDSTNTWDQYTPTHISPDQITFSSVDKSTDKSFTFNQNHMVIEYTDVQPMTVNIPLVLDPWIRFYTDWGARYYAHQSLRGWIWGINESLEVEITSNGKVNLFPFTSSQQTLNQRENPNFEYPPGHFLPFPIALAEVHTNSDSDSLVIRLEYR